MAKDNYLVQLKIIRQAKRPEALASFYDIAKKSYNEVFLDLRNAINERKKANEGVNGKVQFNYLPILDKARTVQMMLFNAHNEEYGEQVIDELWDIIDSTQSLNKLADFIDIHLRIVKDYKKIYRGKEYDKEIQLIISEKQEKLSKYEKNN